MGLVACNFIGDFFTIEVLNKLGEFKLSKNQRGYEKIVREDIYSEPIQTGNAVDMAVPQPSIERTKNTINSIREQWKSLERKRGIKQRPFCYLILAFAAPPERCEREPILDLLLRTKYIRFCFA